jgi:DNA-binding transcriptional regulator YhcF (GntR family)
LECLIGAEQQKTSAHITIANKVEQRILQGKIVKGHKLDSIRHLAEQESFQYQYDTFGP